MTTTFIKGDLFTDGADPGRAHGFAFGVDTSGAMTQGIAIAFAKRWPALVDAVRDAKLQVGDVLAWNAGDGAFVYVLGIATAGKKPKVSALVRALDAMLARATADGVSRIALPKIGASKSSGIDPLRVKKVLTEAGTRTPISLVVFEQFVRAKPADDAAG